ncbi:MAG TPA: TIGR00730 family Rossman fold protein [bacterium]
MRRICVFCGSSPGRSPAYAAAAVALGELLAREGVGLVTGGGRVGLMGTVADATLRAGGQVHGVIPHSLVKKDVAHQGLTQQTLVDTMHQRKQTMVDLSDGFIALPGGMGTLDELCEVLSWAQLGIHDKPVGVLNVQGYFAGFLQQMAHSVEERLLKPEHRAMLQVEETPAALLAAMRAYKPIPVAKWIDRKDA